MLDGGSFRADVSPDIIAGTPLIRGYGDDYIAIADHRYKHGLSIHQGAIISPWGPERVSELSIAHFEHLLQQAPEVLVIGTGRLTAFPDESILQLLAGHHIGFECMDSRAASRTYNILVAEGRPVSAVLLLPNARR